MPARAPTFHGSSDMKRTSSFTNVAAISATLVLALGGFTLGCDDAGPTGAGGSGGSTGTTQGNPFESGTALDVVVPESGRVYVDLDLPAVADETTTWDLAFEGQGVFTNGGESGPGMGSAFGPLDAADFVSEQVPYYPFLIEDEPGGAFVDFYA